MDSKTTWTQLRCYCGAPEVGQRLRVWHDDEYHEGRIVDVGAHWSCQPVGQSGYWVEVEVGPLVR